MPIHIMLCGFHMCRKTPACARPPMTITIHFMLLSKISWGVAKDYNILWFLVSLSCDEDSHPTCRYNTHLYFVHHRVVAGLPSVLQPLCKLNSTLVGSGGRDVHSGKLGQEWKLGELEMTRGSGCLVVETKSMRKSWCEGRVWWNSLGNILFGSSTLKYWSSFRGVQWCFGTLWGICEKQTGDCRHSIKQGREADLFWEIPRQGTRGPGHIFKNTWLIVILTQNLEACITILIWFTPEWTVCQRFWHHKVSAHVCTHVLKPELKSYGNRRILQKCNPKGPRVCWPYQTRALSYIYTLNTHISKKHACVCVLCYLCLKLRVKVWVLTLRSKACATMLCLTYQKVWICLW